MDPCIETWVGGRESGPREEEVATTDRGILDWGERETCPGFTVVGRSGTAVTLF